MNASSRGTNSLEELKALIAFLRSLWGILAGITVLFPLSNVLMRIIPLHRLSLLSPELVTVVTMLASLFTVLLLFTNRYEITARLYPEVLPQDELINRCTEIRFSYPLIYPDKISSREMLVMETRRQKIIIRNRAMQYFGLGIISLTMYLLFHILLFGQIHSDEIVFAEILSVLFYVIFFASTTRAFMILGLIEYLRPPSVVEENNI